MSVSTPAEADPRRWTALVFVCLAQLMVVLDGTIMNIALPSAQHALGFSDGARQWVVTAYALAFGGLLLFGGRLGDLWGRKRAFVTGVIGFAAASALGGIAVNTAMLIGARALQGVFGALLAPAALSLISVMFTETRERAKAFGIYGALAGGGAAIGLLLGGVLTQYLNWRWTLLVNIIFAAVAAIGALAVLPGRSGERPRGARLDIPGVLLASLGLVALVYGLSTAETHGWASATTLSLIGAGVVLLAAFAVLESRLTAPLLPLRVVWDRNRGGAYLAMGLAVIGMFGLLLFLTFYLQNVLAFSPLQCGAAFLPMTLGMVAGSTQIGPRLAPRVAVRALMAPGFLLAAAGLAWLTQITPTSSYTTVVLPGLLVIGLGLGIAFMPAFSLAAQGVAPQDAGVASAMVNTSQQIGGAIGTALLNTLATSATVTYTRHHPGTQPGGPLHDEALVHGYTTAMWWAVGILTLAALAAAALITQHPRRAAHPEDGRHARHKRSRATADHT
ncbi:MFS transporter [Streptomyces sp. NPDC017529]|uniref:MFS transporter n=1 Tax=Streptomyces sp. NPDC017529 TaxID=3365000 RepID=UPI00378A7E97